MKVVASTLGIGPILENISEPAPTLAEWVAQELGRDIEGGEILFFKQHLGHGKKTSAQKTSRGACFKGVGDLVSMAPGAWRVAHGERRSTDHPPSPRLRRAGSPRTTARNCHSRGLSAVLSTAAR